MCKEELRVLLCKYGLEADLEALWTFHTHYIYVSTLIAAEGGKEGGREGGRITNHYNYMSMSPHLSQHSHMYLYLNVKNCMNTIRGGPYKYYKNLVGTFIGTKYNIM